nr:MAG TPA: Dna polymerase B [Bacteriophage sp.]
MATIRVHKTKNYTVMSNTHLRDKKLSLKAKGLLSVMLSLPDTWDYSIAGLVAISKENETAVKSALNELKDNNYVVVTKENPTKSNGGRIKYTYEVYEEPHKQSIEKQDTENLWVECQQVEFHGQLSTNRLSTDELNTNEQSTERLNTDKVHTSTNIDGEVHTSVPKEQTARVTRQDMQAKKSDMLCRFFTICDDNIENKTIREAVKKSFRRYMDLYETYFAKVHPILTDKTLTNVCLSLSNVTDTEHKHFEDTDVYLADETGLTGLDRMVFEHFRRRHRGQTNYSITHFAKSDYLLQLAQGLIEY